MATKNTYQTELEISRLEKLHVLEKQLPIACSDFFRSIAHTTSVLTRLAYAYDYRLFFEYLRKENPDFCDVDPYLINDVHFRKLKGRDIQGFQDYLTQYYTKKDENSVTMLVRNHEQGIMRKLCSLRSLFAYLFKHEHVPSNIASLISLPKLHDKPIIRLEKEEMQRLIDGVLTGDGLTKAQYRSHMATKTRDFAIIMFFLGTGVRVSECVGLNLDDLDFEINACLVTRKGGDQSILYFPDQVADALKAYLKERATIPPLEGHENALFLSLQKRRITQRAVENLVKKYAILAAPLKRKISPHKLRSTFATNLYHETGDIYLVADVLGHSDVNTTKKHYSDITNQHKKRAVKHVVLPQTDKKNKGE